MDKVDKDKDGFVTVEELKDWIRRVAQRCVGRQPLSIVPLACY